MKFVWQISRPPCKWCEFWQVFNGQLGHLYKLGDWKTAESWPMFKFFGRNHLKFYLNGGHFYEIFWNIFKKRSLNRGQFLGKLGWVKFFCVWFQYNPLLASLAGGNTFDDLNLCQRLGSNLDKNTSSHFPYAPGFKV